MQETDDDSGVNNFAGENDMNRIEEIRLVAIDLDQTLLHSDKTFSEYSRTVICRLIEKGILVIPTSGRDLDRMKENILQIPGIRYAIGLNGSKVYDLGNGDPNRDPSIVRQIAGFPLSPDEAIFSLDYMRPWCDILEMDTDRGLLMETVTDSPEAIDFVCKRYFFINFDVQNYVSLSEFVRLEKPKVWKISGFYADRTKFNGILGKKFPRTSIDFCASDDLLTETCSAKASKGNGLKALMEYLGVRKNEVLAMGDNGNDVSMFRVAGISVAVGNALPEVQEEASFTTDTNNNDGAAKALEKLLL